MKKIVENFTIVKPKAERVHFQTKPGGEKPTNPALEKYRKTRHDSTVVSGMASKTAAATTEQSEGTGATKNMKWKDKVKFDAVNEEKKAVEELITW